MVSNPMTGPDQQSPNGIRLDYCGIERLADVMQIMAAAFSEEYGESWNHNQCRSMLSLNGTRLMIASFDDRPCGFTISRAVAGEEELLMIAVNPNYRRNGMGLTMLKQLLAKATDDSIKSVFLEVRSNNPARTLYRRLGFQEIGIRRAYYTGADENKFDAITYKFPIGDIDS